MLKEFGPQMRKFAVRSLVSEADRSPVVYTLVLACRTWSGLIVAGLVSVPVVISVMVPISILGRRALWSSRSRWSRG